MKTKLKVCGLCKRKIEDKDNYVRLTDYKEGDFFMEGFFHTNCFNERDKAKAKMIMQKAGKLVFSQLRQMAQQ